MSEWRAVQLGDVLTLQRGFDLPARLRADGPYPVVSSSGVTGTHAEYKVEPPGIVIGRYGSLGSVHWITDPYWPLNTSLWVKDFKGNDPRFLSYLLRTVSMDGSTASAVPGVNRNHLHTIPVRCPESDTQRRIAAMLAAFDELIDINQRRIVVLEDLARSLYREWFVHFRFRGHEDVELVDSELGPIPGGWCVVPLGELAEQRSVGVLTAELSSEVDYVGLEHLPRRSTTLRTCGNAVDVTSRKLRYERGDVLFGKIRPYFHKVAWAPSAGVTSVDTIVLRARSNGAAGLVMAVTSSDEFVAEAVASSNGTKMPRASWDALQHFAVALPPPSSPVTERFEQTTKASLELCAALATQNRALSATRDLLLPRLVTGRLDISDLDLGDLLPAGAA